MFFLFRQNNTGGDFHLRPDKGISVRVVVEAGSSAAADARAEAIGLYFDGVEDGHDCECCGDRWYRAHLRGGFDDPARVADALGSTDWTAGEAAYTYVHYLDGRVLGLDIAGNPC